MLWLRGPALHLSALCRHYRFRSCSQYVLRVRRELTEHPDIARDTLLAQPLPSRVRYDAVWLKRPYGDVCEAMGDSVQQAVDVGLPL